MRTISGNLLVSNPLCLCMASLGAQESVNRGKAAAIPRICGETELSQSPIQDKHEHNLAFSSLEVFTKEK